MKNAQNTQGQAVSKAEAKRIAYAKDRFTSLLNTNLKDFKNLYLQSSVEFGIKMEKRTAERRIAELKEKISSDNGYFTSQIERIEQSIANEMLMTLEFINEANKSFNQKIDSMVQKMIEANINTPFLRLQRIAGGTPSEFSFLVSDDKIELHARTIFACGEIKAPHFRFITTIRNK